MAASDRARLNLKRSNLADRWRPTGIGPEAARPSARRRGLRDRDACATAVREHVPSPASEASVDIEIAQTAGCGSHGIWTTASVPAQLV